MTRQSDTHGGSNHCPPRGLLPALRADAVQQRVQCSSQCGAVTHSNLGPQAQEFINPRTLAGNTTT
jgi:hypothetical protein